MAESQAMQPYYRRPPYKYGVLAVLTALLLLHLWTLVFGGFGTVAGAKNGLVVVSMLIVNHASFSFLTPLQQRRFRPLQWAIILGGLAYVALEIWREVGNR